MEIFSKLGGMAPVYEGAGSYFALEQSLMIFVMWPSALATLCNKFGQNSCMLVVSLPLEALHRSAFSIQVWPQRVSGHVMPLCGGVSKSNRMHCFLSTRSAFIALSGAHARAAVHTLVA